MYRKKAKLSYKLSFIKDSEQETVITTNEPLVSSLVGDQSTLSPTTSMTSQDQQKIQINTPTTGETYKSIMDIFKEIKVRNEALNIDTYNQFWKQTSSSQSRLLSAFDLEKGKMQMAFLQAQVPQPKVALDYKKTTFEFDVKDIHPIDQMEINKQTREVIFSTITNTTMSLSKLQVTLANVQSQLEMEKVSALAKDTRIKTMEDLVTKVGYDSSNINVAEELIKKNNLDIAELSKKLKFPAPEDPLAKDIEETETQKADMMKLIMEQSAQLKQMETKLEKLIK